MTTPLYIAVGRTTMGDRPYIRAYISSQPGRPISARRIIWRPIPTLAPTS